MLTRWGETLDKDTVLQEYPRPQLVRESYYNLNGLWDYAITASDACPSAWDGNILMPFSPEAPLSAPAWNFDSKIPLFRGSAPNTPGLICCLNLR